METYRHPQFHVDLSTVHVALFTAVTNASLLRARIVKAATMPGQEGDDEREAVNFAFIDARLITSPLHLRTAIYQAILAESEDSLRTKTVHSEILWTLNPTNNITEAIRRYGVSDSSTALIVVRVSSPDLADPEGKMKAVVLGDITPLSDMQKITDWSLIKKHHKLNTELAIKDAAGRVAHEHAVIDNIVVSSVAMKNVMG